jgi:hypothetical protein
MFIYETYGPFPLERDGNKIRKEALTKLWKDIATDHQGLAGAIGVYVLAVRAKKDSALKPWYVGKTDRQSFKTRFYQQLARFSDVLDYAKNGTPHVFLLARLTPGRKDFKKPTSTALASNDELETMLIASCLKQNERLVNAMKVKHAKEIVVPGYMNNAPGKLTGSASELNRMVKAK